MNKPSHVLTRRGANQLEKDLNELRSVKRPEIAKRIQIARGFGDLSENAEYKAALELQEEIELRINEIETTLRFAQIIEDEDISTESVGIGTTVRLFDEEANEELEFKIVGTKETNIYEGKMSNESPVGAAIMGHAVGEEITVETPSGTLKFKILDIRKDES